MSLISPITSNILAAPTALSENSRQKMRPMGERTQSSGLVSLPPIASRDPGVVGPVYLGTISRTSGFGTAGSTANPVETPFSVSA